MSRPTLPSEAKAKRNNFTLTTEAQEIIKTIGKNKSKFVSLAIIAYAKQSKSEA